METEVSERNTQVSVDITNGHDPPLNGLSHAQVADNKINIDSASNASPQNTVNSSQNGDKRRDSEPVLTPKVNAFQFMMDNRNRVIGRNSPGKEIDLDETPNSAKRTDLKARKKALEEWADVKGASKRKREDEEKGNTISYKLEKRAKKLRNMFKLQSHSDDEVVVKDRRRRCAQIESDSDDSIEKSGEKENERKKKIKRMSLNKSKTEEISTEIDNETKKIKRKRGRPRKVDNNKNDNLLTPTDTDATVAKEENLLIDKTPQDDTKEKIETAEKNHTGGMLLRTRKQKPKSEDYVSLSDSEDEKQETKTSKTKKNHNNKTMKVAPVFLKAAPKPKLDPEVVEARRQFLLSGIPSCLKKEMDKQQSFSNEEVDFDVFPVISHVQQKTENSIWNLPKVELDLIQNDCTNFEIDSFSFKSSKDQSTKCNYPLFHRVNNLKKHIQEIKAQNPNYTVYKTFKSLYNKSGYKVQNENDKREVENKNAPKRRGRKKKNQTNSCTDTEILKPVKTQIANSMWTDKYKAESSSEIIGNRRSISALKDWLTNWMNMKNDTKKKNYDSESEFDTTDGDSRDSLKIQGNTLVLKGPIGSGKTAAVYAVCNELGFNVLEVNASSKRTGKWLLQELQEATQSHQVRKKKSLLSFIKEQKVEETTDHKMCVLLIEDIDIVFDQDEGFSAALSQLISTSKRPIILTISSETSNQKILNHHHSITFAPLSPILAIWLQILCLIEGCYIHASSLEELLRHNRGDIRRTLLQLQFWVTSGGQLTQNEHQNGSVQAHLNGCSEIETEEDSNMSDLRLDEVDEVTTLHSDCLTSFEPVIRHKLCTLPYLNNFEVIWWNTPHIFDLHDFSGLRLNRDGGDCYPSSGVRTEPKEIQKLKTLSDFYESLSFVDTICGPNGINESLQKWRTEAKDSLSLDENTSGYQDESVTNDLAHTLLSGRIQIYKEKFDETFRDIKLAVPSVEEQRWRLKQISCEEKLEEVLLQSDCLGRKSIVLDYIPCLRAISRSECERAVNNTKRRNRFYNYLRSLGVSGGETTFKTACNIFKVCQ